VNKKLADQASNADRSPMLRSRVSNRAGRLPGVDGRCERARRFRDLTSGLKRDIRRTPSAAEESLIDQAAALMIEREVMTAASALGEPIESKELVRISGAVGRTLAALGLTQRHERAARHSVASIENPAAAPMSNSERASKIEQLFERARHSHNTEVLAVAAGVREILKTAQHRKDAITSTRPSRLAAN
jgi:hypothetical protein